jgi:hypothetical protein
VPQRHCARGTLLGDKVAHVLAKVLGRHGQLYALKSEFMHWLGSAAHCGGSIICFRAEILRQWLLFRPLKIQIWHIITRMYFERPSNDHGD